VYFDRAGFDGDKQYFVCFELQHPGRAVHQVDTITTVAESAYGFSA